MPRKRPPVDVSESAESSEASSESSLPVSSHSDDESLSELLDAIQNESSDDADASFGGGSAGNGAAAAASSSNDSAHSFRGAGPPVYRQQHPPLQGQRQTAPLQPVFVVQPQPVFVRAPMARPAVVFTVQDLVYDRVRAKKRLVMAMLLALLGYAIYVLFSIAVGFLFFLNIEPWSRVLGGVVGAVGFACAAYGMYGHKGLKMAHLFRYQTVSAAFAVLLWLVTILVLILLTTDTARISCEQTRNEGVDDDDGGDAQNGSCETNERIDIGYMVVGFSVWAIFATISAVNIRSFLQHVRETAANIHNDPMTDLATAREPGHAHRAV